MYSPSENAQATQSKQMISDALFNLMNRYSYKEITITQICQEAQVVRQTFYRNFETKEDILEYYLDELFLEYVHKFYKKSDEEGSELLKSYQKTSDAGYEILNFYKFLELKKPLMTNIEKNQLIFVLERIISKNVTRFFDLSVTTSITVPHLVPYVSALISSTVCSILGLWIRNGYQESPEELKTLTALFLSGLGKETADYFDKISN
jgi:AcrR family transcriptional regulator